MENLFILFFHQLDFPADFRNHGPFLDFLVSVPAKHLAPWGNYRSFFQLEERTALGIDFHLFYSFFVSYSAFVRMRGPLAPQLFSLFAIARPFSVTSQTSFPFRMNRRTRPCCSISRRHLSTRAFASLFVFGCFICLSRWWSAVLLPASRYHTICPKSRIILSFFQG